MQCCGPIYDITTMDDRSPVYLCGQCGKQGPASAFPDPQPERPKPLTRRDRVRYGIAEALDSLAAWIAPK